MPTVTVPGPPEAQAVAERFARSVEGWRSLPPVFAQATAQALGVVTDEWTRAEIRELEETLRDVIGKQLAVLDEFAPSATAVPALAALAGGWADQSSAAEDARAAFDTGGPLRALGTWHGEAGQIHRTQARARAGEAALVARAAADIAAALDRLAVVGLAFTVAAGTIIEKTTAELVGCARAIATGVGVLRSFGLALRAAAAAGEFITGAGGDLVDAVRAEAATLASLDEGGTM